MLDNLVPCSKQLERMKAEYADASRFHVLLVPCNIVQVVCSRGRLSMGHSPGGGLDWCLGFGFEALALAGQWETAGAPPKRGKPTLGPPMAAGHVARLRMNQGTAAKGPKLDAVFTLEHAKLGGSHTVPDWFSFLVRSSFCGGVH